MLAPPLRPTFRLSSSSSSPSFFSSSSSSSSSPSAPLLFRPRCLFLSMRRVDVTQNLMILLIIVLRILLTFLQSLLYPLLSGRIMRMRSRSQRVDGQEEDQEEERRLDLLPLLVLILPTSSSHHSSSSSEPCPTHPEVRTVVREAQKFVPRYCTSTVRTSRLHVDGTRQTVALHRLYWVALHHINTILYYTTQCDTI